jgi:hypothetical protein
MKALFKIFFGVESAEEMKKRGLAIALVVPAIRWGEWALVGATATLVALLKTWGLGDITIFFILWMGNLLISGGIVKLNQALADVDVTLMEGLRRLIDAAINKSRIAGFLMEFLIVIRLIVWDGASYFIIFFHSRFNAQWKKRVAFIMASGVQMAIWTALYVAGYNSFSELFRKLF